MKNKSSIMKLLIMIFVMLVITLLVLVIFLVKRIQGLEKQEKDNKKNYNKIHIIKKEYNIDTIDGLYFDFMNAKVYYYSTDNDKMTIKQTGRSTSNLYNKKINNNKLYISESNKNIFGKTIFKIYIPNKFMNTISIKNGFGNIKIDSFNNYLIIDNNAGNVMLENTIDIDISNISGSVNVNNIKGLLNLTSSTGDIFIDKLEGNCDIETITGNLKIDDFVITDKSRIETTSGDLNIKVNKESDCLFRYTKNENYNITKKKCNNGKNVLTLKNVTGNIVIK